MNKKYIVQARVFKAMSDENRLKILELLHEREYNATELLNEMDFGQSTPFPSYADFAERRRGAGEKKREMDILFLAEKSIRRNGGVASPVSVTMTA